MGWDGEAWAMVLHLYMRHGLWLPSGATRVPSTGNWERVGSYGWPWGTADGLGEDVG